MVIAKTAAHRGTVAQGGSASCWPMEFRDAFMEYGTHELSFAGGVEVC